MNPARSILALAAALSLAACNQANTPPATEQPPAVQQPGTGTGQQPGTSSPTPPTTDGGSQISCGTKGSPGQPGSPDSSFGQGGVLTIDFGSPFDAVPSIAVTPQGCVVAIVTRGDSNGAWPSTVAHFTATGQLDSTFDGDGRVDVARGHDRLLVQVDGKVITGGAGPLLYGTSAGGMTITRLNSDGSLDATFDGDGHLQTDFDVRDVALQADGKIVAIGQQGRGNPSSTDDLLSLARYNPDGSPDASFGRGGRVAIKRSDTGPGSYYPHYENLPSRRLTVAPDGKIVTAGTASYTYTSNGGLFGAAYAVMRFNSDGSVDSQFGNNELPGLWGHWCNRFCIHEVADVAVANDGRPLLALGSTVTWVSADGKNHGSWNVQSPYEVSGTSGVRALAVQADGKVVTAARAYTSRENQPKETMVVARLLTDGQLDATFGGNGKVYVQSAANSFSDAIALDGSDALLIAGQAGDNGAWDAAIARLWR